MHLLTQTTRRLAQSWLLSACITILTLLSCKKENTPDPVSTKKAITSFLLKYSSGAAIDSNSITVSITNDSILIGLPSSVDISNLIPEIEFTGISISPKSGLAQNFTQPVTYTVTAADGTTHTYVVKLSKNIINNLVFIGSSNNSFYALDANTGSIKWQYNGTNGFSYSSPTYDSGVVYAGSIDNYLYAFDALTGAIKWQFLTGGFGIESSPTVKDNIVYVGSNDDYLYAINKVTGTLLWKYQTAQNVSSTPLVYNGTVYVGSSDNYLYALNAITGALQWKYATGALINQSSPALYNNNIIIGSRDGYLHAVNATTGTLQWRFSTGGISLEMSNPTVANDIVYIGGWYNFNDFKQKGSLYAVNAATGTLVWHGLDTLGIGSDPCVTNNQVFVSSDDGNTYAINAATGNVLWQKTLYANGAGATVSDGTVYIGGGGTGYFYALDAVTGQQKWKTAIPNGIMTSTPCVLGTAGTIHRGGEPSPAT
ncbi:Outer membrane protein assembly factor BamB, contains PQQ-like beta-propeller repeat [Filimonas lacunae]|uniref:Outer membrane protein assembly factor BamB, contains PQQ-like beta-propeller repeat n=1 Tax=Filimonas lacunae TaxID=477680 RepID=A0A173MII8_9BACT|nr:PQQ-binding-like beta-propeller repeat protein [Filimonas lacunae]BAV07277.1 cell surface protein [Filimonas lacunae]SIS92142.1 Outer membrane protein assembly factor BamB, contains PQQ-like beta-propeller repeat [Filimonas lacunae]